MVKILIYAFIALCLGSCSWVTSKRSLFGEEENPKDQAGETVPKALYHDLLKKYENLKENRQMDQLALNEVEKNPRNSASDQLTQKIQNIPSNPNLETTVDVFSRPSNAPAAPSLEEMGSDKFLAPSLGQRYFSEAMIEKQVKEVRQLEKLVNLGEFTQATSLARNLEQSQIPQVRVRAKFFLGEILFRQKEYDLSAQIFEEIIQKHAFSGVVIKTLGRLIVCTEKLKANDKKERYFSILNDFFEQDA